MRYSEHRDALLRRTVIQLLPSVARKDPPRFRAQFAPAAVAHLIHTLHRGPSERGLAFLSLAALLPVAGPAHVQPHRDDILALVLDGITPSPRKPLVLEAATCVASLAALEPSDPVVIERMPDLVEQMLAAAEGNLAPMLIAALSDIVRSMPLLLPDIQMKLLDSISFTLQRTPYQPSGTPNYRRIAPVRGGTPIGGGAASGPRSKDREAAVMQALGALAEFDFAGHQLSEFVQDCVALYLEDATPRVRLVAVKTCCHLLLRAGDVVPRRGGSCWVVSQVLEKLLVTAVSDPEPHIRVAVCVCLCVCVWVGWP